MHTAKISLGTIKIIPTKTSGATASIKKIENQFQKIAKEGIIDVEKFEKDEQEKTIIK